MRTGRAAVAALLCALLAGCSGGAGSSADLSRDAPAPAPVPAGLPERCPPDDTPLRLAAADLPSGAVGVRLCPGAPDVAASGTRRGPFVQPVADELTTGVEPLVDLVNSLPAYETVPSGRPCPLDGGPMLVYWFRYPDGDARAVAYGEYGCHTLQVGEDLGRENGEQLAQAFADALWSQRAASQDPASAPVAPAAPDCPEPTGETRVSMLPRVPMRLTSATWCQVVSPSRMQSAAVLAPLLRRLNDGLLGKQVEDRDRCKSVDYWQSIEGFNDWGDRVSYMVTSDCRVYARVGYGRDTATGWFDAAPELIAALRALPRSGVGQ